jgi:hypothetical protein
MFKRVLGLIISLACAPAVAQQILVPVLGSAPTGTCTQSWTHVQGVTGTGGTTTITATLGSNPATGNLVAIALATYNNGNNTAPTVTVADANSNHYTVTAASPGGNVTTYNGFLYIAYLLSAPANASKTITATMSSTDGGYAALFVDEFHPNCSASLDSGTASGTGTAGPATSPTVSVSGTSDLLYAIVTTTNQTASTGSPWTAAGSGSVVSGSWIAEYKMDATANTAVNFSLSAAYAAIGASFK